MAAVIYRHRRRHLNRNRIFRDKANPLEVFDDLELYKRFRFRRIDIIKIVHAIRDDINYNVYRRSTLSPELQVLVALRFYATGSFQNLVGDTINVHQSTINKQRCAGILLSVICSGLQLSSTSMDCRPCSCHPDPDYGGTLADCSDKELRRVSLPAPGNITTLLLDHNPITKLSISDFDGMENLRHLSVAAGSITQIEEAPVVIFRNLEYLDISRNRDLGFTEAVKIASWFEMNTLKELRLGYIVSLINPIVALDGLYCRFFQNSPLMELQLDGNAFSYFAKDCISYWPNTIEILSVRYTMIGDYDGKNFTGLLTLRSLRILDLTGFVSWNPGNGHTSPWHTPAMIPFLPVMPSLEVVRYGQAFQHMDVGKCTLIPTINNLTTIDFSENILMSLTGPWSGMGNVENVDVSQNWITSVGKALFVGSNNVKVVNISNNDLGRNIESDTSGDILKQFNNLQVLDISKNGISFLPKQIFHGLVTPRYINISGNFLTKLDVDISQMSSLKEINVRNNKLSTLSQHVLNHLNRLPGVKVIMDDNPLSCSCETLEFLEWMRDSDHLQGRDNLTCTLTNGTNIKLQNLDHIVSSLHESCRSDLVLIASSVSGAFAVLMLISGFMVYRHRWKLRYLYHAGRNRYQLVNNEDDIDIYQYDAFISYADTNRTFVKEKMLVELEDKSGLKVCIHSRDFLPGDIITENIINAIQNSRKTVILLSPEFLKSEWCIYEFHMARLDGITRKLNNILVILLQEVAVNQLPKDLALMMTRNSYLEYSTDEYGEVVFWNTLTEGIKTLKRTE